jgi:hypothetical protein
VSLSTSICSTFTGSSPRIPPNPSELDIVIRDLIPKLRNAGDLEAVTGLLGTELSADPAAPSTRRLSWTTDASSSRAAPTHDR